MGRHDDHDGDELRDQQKPEVFEEESGDE